MKYSFVKSLLLTLGAICVLPIDHFEVEYVTPNSVQARATVPDCVGDGTIQYSVTHIRPDERIEYTIPVLVSPKHRELVRFAFHGDGIYILDATVCGQYECVSATSPAFFHKQPTAW